MSKLVKTGRNRAELEQKIAEIDRELERVQKNIDYYDAMQQALKLILNGSYGAFAAQYFILFNNQVAGTITAEGRQLTKTMGQKNKDYWYDQWHLDTELHKILFIKDVKRISTSKHVTIYGDTDSIFVGYEPAIDSCQWKNRLFNDHFLNGCPRAYSIIGNPDDESIKNISNDNFTKIYSISDIHAGLVDKIDNIDLVIIDGRYVNDKKLNKLIKSSNLSGRILYNWSRELDFIHGIDRFRIAGYFVKCLEEHAASYGVENIEDFELEKINEAVINLEKKKYIMHQSWEEGVEFERLSRIVPKGVELTRSSTPTFARDKKLGIYRIVNYLFEDPKNFNIKELVRIVKDMRRQFELADINDISVQSSCSKYEEKVVNDTTAVMVVSQTHFAVKAAAYHNMLLYNNAQFKNRYNSIRSGNKVKIYYCKTNGDKSAIKVFAFKRGAFPIEFAPEVNYDLQFEKVILNTVNNIIKKLNMPLINRRLNVLIDIFSGINLNKPEDDNTDEIEDITYEEGVVDKEEEDVYDKSVYVKHDDQYEGEAIDD